MLNDRLRIERFGGNLVLPEDSAYDDARALFNGMIDRRPAVIAQCRSTDDVVAAIRFGRERQLPIAVRGGGHNVAGHGSCAGGVVIDLRLMKQIDVDAAGGTVTTQGGVLWGELDARTQEHGLAVTGGRVSTTGVIGLAVVSGSGWLERLHGFTCDNLVSAELVTADGDVVTVSDSENPDLLWALRGAGTNFGVITSLTMRLHAVGPTVLGGLMQFHGRDPDEMVEAWRDVMRVAPSHFDAGLVCLTAPQAPYVPADLQGKPALGLLVCSFGDQQTGRDIVEQFRGIRKPFIDDVGLLPYTQLQQLIDPFAGHGERHCWKADHLAELDAAAIVQLVEHARSVPSPLSEIVIEAKGCKIAEVGEDETPMSGRSAPFDWYCQAIWDDPSDDARQIAWASDLAEAMRPHAIPGISMNFLSDEGPERVRATFGERKYHRLADLKRQWDPHNIFRLNANIPPAG
jgi:FAD/FMN-containing dehydrogenase